MHKCYNMPLKCFTLHTVRVSRPDNACCYKSHVSLFFLSMIRMGKIPLSVIERNRAYIHVFTHHSDSVLFTDDNDNDDRNRKFVYICAHESYSVSDAITDFCCASFVYNFLRVIFFLPLFPTKRKIQTITKT